MGLLVDQAGEELLGVADDQGPGEDLGGGVAVWQSGEGGAVPLVTGWVCRRAQRG
jgi:hypothetical protein